MKWLVGAAILAAAGSAAPQSAVPFSVGVETAWSAPPLLLEILETAYDESPSSYFPLLRLLTSHVVGLHKTPESQYEHALQLMGTHHICSGQESTFNLALSLHTTAPRIEAAFAQYAKLNETSLGVSDCEAWVDFNGKAYCDAETLRRAIERGIDADKTEPYIRTLPFDHASGDEPKAIFYYSPSPDALALLTYLDQHTRAVPEFSYVVRYRPTGGRTRKTPLSGYGVEMALKKTDYLVVDDRVKGSKDGKQAVFESKTKEVFPELGEDPWTENSKPLTEKEAQNVGLNAITVIKSAKNPLKAFTHLTQNLPKYTAALARKITVPESIKKRARALAREHPVGPLFLLNGKVIKDTDVNAFGLLNAIRAERPYVASLLELGFTPQEAVGLLSDEVIGTAQAGSNPSEGLVDASDKEEGGGVISWLNNIETDPMYARYPHSLSGYMRPTYPGQLHLVRRNSFNGVLAVDLSNTAVLHTVAKEILAFLKRGVPVRFGIVAQGDNTAGKVFGYINNNFGPSAGADFITALNTLAEGPTISETAVETAFDQVKDDTGGVWPPYEKVLTSKNVQRRSERSEQWLDRVGALPSEAPNGVLFVNGKDIPLGVGWNRGFQNEIVQQTQMLQQMIATGGVDDRDDLSRVFYDLPTTLKRKSKYVVPKQGSKLAVYNLGEVFNGSAKALAENFVYPAGDAHVPLTTWVIGDLDSSSGLAVARNAVEYLQKEGCKSRLGFVNVQPPGGSGYFSTLIYELITTGELNKVKPEQLLEFLDELENQPKPNIDQLTLDEVQAGQQPQELDNGKEEAEPLNAFTAAGWTVGITNEAGKFWDTGRTVAHRLGVNSTEPYVLVNGRLIGPIDDTSSMKARDFEFLEEYEAKKRVDPVAQLVQTMSIGDGKDIPRDRLADVVMRASSIIASAYNPRGAEGIFIPYSGPRARPYEQMDKGETSIQIGDFDSALFHVGVIVDPISETAQRWSGLLELLSSLDHVAITIHFDPNPAAKEVKVKRFYRESLRPALTFDVDGNEVSPDVRFLDLPVSPIYTLGMTVPQAWIIRPKDSPLDLDNLMLGQLHEPTHVLFDLEQLVMDGHAREGVSQPPTGLQLQLLDEGEVVSDTQVMTNLGYLQFKAPPGVYHLGIRPGRGQDVFSMQSAGNDGWESPSVDEAGDIVTLTSLEGNAIYPRFARKDGMEEADVFVEESSGGWLNKIKSVVGLTPSKPSRHADINIFTVASGLLYERFASIMMLSVMKHTNSSVKFWFIENFLSPTFLKFLPEMAEKYGFQYELVTYKWPSWLRAQSEKQRIIWAYKILFLDVLFPMDLDKVIFVDADQIVRTDMKELVDLDMQGHVYAYPPMGDDREEMEGFRFWKQGYWKNELRGKPYHISALYVVDLKRFRQRTAGDRLRGMYHALSADPNSLANLDQDLPNSMQQQIPILTLDKDWLWCQTWCSDESLKTAKTIDLCQNPLTKEPKLVRARQIPEWDSYDREIAEFAASLGQSELGASVDDLAGTLEKAQGLADSDSPSSPDSASSDASDTSDTSDVSPDSKPVSHEAADVEVVEDTLAEKDVEAEEAKEKPKAKEEVKRKPSDPKRKVTANRKSKLQQKAERAAADAAKRHPADGRAAVHDSVVGEDVEVLVSYSDEPGAVWDAKAKNPKGSKSKAEGESGEGEGGEPARDEL